MNTQPRIRIGSDSKNHRPLIKTSDVWERWDDVDLYISPKISLPITQLSPAQRTALVSFSKAFLNGKAELMEGVEPPSALCWQFLMETVLQVQLSKDNTLKDIVTTDHELWNALGCSRLPPDTLRKQLKHLIANAFHVQWWWADGESARWVDKVWYSKITSDLVIRLSSDLIPHIFNLKKHFCQLSVESMRMLTAGRRGSAPSRATLGYMHFKQFVNFNSNMPMTVTEFLAVIGVSADHPDAKNWSRIKARLIAPLIKTFSQYTDIKLDIVNLIRDIGKGRRKGPVTGFKFKVTIDKDKINSWKRQERPGVTAGQAVPKNRQL